MRVVVQRSKEASVTVEDEIVGSIDRGLVVLLAVAPEDTQKEADWMAEKVAHLRIFPDAAGKMNRSVLDEKGGILVVSQFTLYGDCRKGRRPHFGGAARPESRFHCMNIFVVACGKSNFPCATGRFGAMMQVQLINDGPVTLVIDLKEVNMQLWMISLVLLMGCRGSYDTGWRKNTPTRDALYTKSAIVPTMRVSTVLCNLQRRAKIQSKQRGRRRIYGLQFFGRSGRKMFGKDVDIYVWRALGWSSEYLSILSWRYMDLQYRVRHSDRPIWIFIPLILALLPFFWIDKRRCSGWCGCWRWIPCGRCGGFSKSFRSTRGEDISAL